EDLADERRELRPPVVDDRLRHGAHDPLGHERGARDLQERPTGHARLLPGATTWSGGLDRRTRPPRTARTLILARTVRIVARARAAGRPPHARAAGGGGGPLADGVSAAE